LNWVIDLKKSSSTDVARTTRQRQEDDLNEMDVEKTSQVSGWHGPNCSDDVELAVACCR
jgi:hypothetical protein